LRPSQAIQDLRIDGRICVVPASKWIGESELFATASGPAATVETIAASTAADPGTVAACWAKGPLCWS
jgi:hypothetical protein